MRLWGLIAALPLAACSFAGDGPDSPGLAGSGSGTARSYAAADFSTVELRGPDDVDIRVGTGFSVRAEGDAKELDKLRIIRDGDTLRIGRRSGNGFRWSGDRHSLRILVTMPRIAASRIAGSGNMTVDRVEGESFKAETAGSGGFEIGALNVQSAEFSIMGSGDMRLSGRAGRLSLNIAGSGGIDGAGLKAQAADVSIAGSGGVRADVAGSATVSVMGSGDVDLGPDARCTVSKMGSGNVRCGG